MNGYFKPLRRKIGVVTLLLACAFSLMWLRSMSHVDSIQFWRGDLTCYGLKSCPLGIALTLYDDQNESATKAIGLHQFSVKSATAADLSESSLVNGRFGPERLSFRCLTIKCYSMGFQWSPTRNIIYDIWIVPYWSIVIPLTLFSAWLLLGRPRVKITAPPAEPEV